MKKTIRYKHKIFRQWCKACGLCTHFCPKGVIIADDLGKPIVAYPDNCIGCRLCEMLCPDFAIEVEDEEVSSGE